METKRQTPWMHGRKNAAKPDEEKRASYIHARCLSQEKALWVKAAQREGMKLTEWIVKTLNNNS